VITLFALAVLLDVHVHGVVRDTLTREPLHAATIRIVGTTRGAVSDRDGVFHIHDVAADSVLLQISHVGYATKRTMLAVRGRDDVRIEVLLAPSQRRSDETVVIDSRTSHTSSALPTQHVTELSAAQIDEHRGQTFADVLTRVPGVTVVQTGPSISKPMIHGMMGQRIILRNNGVVQEGQQWGAEHAPEIDPFTPARIAVVKGPASVMYGPNAMGGVIDVLPRPLPRDSVLHGEASANLFSNSGQGAIGGFLEDRVEGDLGVAYRVQGAIRRAGDARTPTYVLGNTGFSESSLGGTIGAGNDELGVTVMGSLYSTTLGVFAGSHLGNAEDLRRAIERGRPSTSPEFGYAITSPRQEISHTLLSVQGHAQLFDDAMLRVTYGWQQNNRSEFDAHNTRIIGPDSAARLQRALRTPAMNLLLTTYTLDTKLEHALADNVRGTAGISAQRQVNDRSGTVYLVPDYVAWGLGGFAYESLMLDDLTLSAGVRYDVRWLDVSLQRRNTTVREEQQRTFASVTASAGALYAISDEQSIGLNIARAWRPPQVNELYANDVHHGSALYEIGDSTLHEERSIGIDATYTLSMRSVEVEATVYANMFDGYILALPDPTRPTITVRGTFPTYRFTQVPALIAGGDVSLRVNVIDEFQAYATASVVRGTDTRAQQPLFLMPSDRARLGMHIHTDDVWELHDAFVDVSVLGVRRQDRYVVGQDYAPPPAGYALLDASLGGMIDLAPSMQMRVTLSCNNILNTQYRDYLNRYRYFADDPGRNIILRITTMF
jgi:iron complex outermembrane receptor protein